MNASLEEQNARIYAREFLKSELEFAKHTLDFAFSQYFDILSRPDIFGHRKFGEKEDAKQPTTPAQAGRTIKVEFGQLKHGT